MIDSLIISVIGMFGRGGRIPPTGSHDLLRCSSRASHLSKFRATSLPPQHISYTRRTYFVVLLKTKAMHSMLRLANGTSQHVITGPRLAQLVRAGVAQTSKRFYAQMPPGGGHPGQGGGFPGFQMAPQKGEALKEFVSGATAAMQSCCGTHDRSRVSISQNSRGKEGLTPRLDVTKVRLCGLCRRVPSTDLGTTEIRRTIQSETTR